MTEEKIDWEWIETYSKETSDDSIYFDQELGKAVLYLKNKLESCNHR